MSVKIYFPRVCKAMNLIHSNTQIYIIHVFFLNVEGFLFPLKNLLKYFSEVKGPQQTSIFLNVSAPVSLNFTAVLV